MNVSRHENESVLHDFAKISLAYDRLPSAVARCLACLHPLLWYIVTLVVSIEAQDSRN